jgi:hypothetical protein
MSVLGQSAHERTFRTRRRVTLTEILHVVVSLNCEPLPHDTRIQLELGIMAGCLLVEDVDDLVVVSLSP